MVFFQYYLMQNVCATSKFSTMSRVHRALRQYSKSPSISFVPTAKVPEYESLKRKLQENEAAVPDRPQFDREKLFVDMVKPQDVCDLVLNPAFEDILITSLAKKSPVSGHADYKLTLRSDVKGSTLLFANLVVEWMKQLQEQNPTLKAPANFDQGIKFASAPHAAGIIEKYNGTSLDSYTKIEQFYNELASQASIEDVTLFLLENIKTSEEYGHISSYLQANVHRLGAFSLGEFVGELLDDILQVNLLMKAEYFERFFVELAASYPDLLESLDVPTLDKLACVLSSLGSLATSKDILLILVTKHKTAPSRATFDLFISRYMKAAEAKSKQDILLDLGLLKPIFFYHGLDANSFRFLLTYAIDNIYDLSHFVKLVKSTSAHLLPTHGVELLRKAHAVQASSESALVRAVQITQLAKTVAGDEPNGDVTAVLSQILTDLGIALSTNGQKCR